MGFHCKCDDSWFVCLFVCFEEGVGGWGSCASRISYTIFFGYRQQVRNVITDYTHCLLPNDDKVKIWEC